MPDNVDRVYALNRAKAASRATHLEPSLSSLDTVSSAPPASTPYSFQRTIQTGPDYDPHHPLSSSLISPHTRTSPLTQLFQTHSPSPAVAEFLPANEDLPVHLASLPGEILEHIMSHMDVAALENFGSTCWKARWATAHSEYWRVKAGKMYSREAVNPEGVSMADLGKKYGGEWRTCLIEQERVRMDGCYIAVCHYV
jgi:F-box protein 9